MLPRFTMTVFSSLWRVVGCALVLALPAQAAELQVREFPRATTSAVSGLMFSDTPKKLPIDTRFSEAIQTVAFDLGMSCRQIEAYGWTLKPDEQERVDKIFTESAEDLTRQGYVVKPQNPASAAADITVYSATRPATPNDHVLMMWSAGDAGLLLLTCDAKGAGDAPVATAADDGAGFPDSAPYVDTNPTKLVGEWMGHYTCRSQGITGATLTITKAKLGTNHDNHQLEAVFSFYPTPVNQGVASGSYQLRGTYDEETQQAYFTPGAWSQHPAGYTTNPLMVYFDIQRGRLSGIFQETTGCTSFEAGLKAGGGHTAAAKKEKKQKPKAKKVKKPVVAAAPKKAETTVEVSEPKAAESEGVVPVVEPVAPTVAAPVVAPEIVSAPAAAEVAAPMPDPAPVAASPVMAPAAPAPTPVAAPAAKPVSDAAPVSTAPAAPAKSTTSTTIMMPSTKSLVIPKGDSSVVDVAPKSSVLDDAAASGADKSLSGLAIPPAKAPVGQ